MTDHRLAADRPAKTNIDITLLMIVFKHSLQARSTNETDLITFQNKDNNICMRKEDVHAVPGWLTMTQDNQVPGWATVKDNTQVTGEEGKRKCASKCVMTEHVVFYRASPAMPAICK